MKSSMILINREILLVDDPVKYRYIIKSNNEFSDSTDSFEDKKHENRKRIGRTFITKLRCWSCGLSVNESTICDQCKYKN
jgi:hypothetical protein